MLTHKTDRSESAAYTAASRMDLRGRLGVAAGKLLSGFTRLSGRGGTTLPGRMALKLSPGLMSGLGAQLKQGSLVVTGTNGKTTTANLITGILRQAGYTYVHNHSGSNMTWGVASSLIDNASWGGRLRGDFAVMEADEGAFPLVIKSLRPRGAVVTNIYRDQLDRFGEIDHIQKTIQRGLDTLPAGGFQALNADDPSLTGMRSEWPGRKWFYGLEIELPPDRFQNTARDIKSCPRCHHELHYDRVYFAHLGHYRCPSCDFCRPQPEVQLVGRTAAADGGSLLEVKLKEETFTVRYPLTGTYNLYNALAAITCGAALGLSPQVIAEAMAAATPSFGRMERFTMKGGSTLLMVLIKNPVGANEVMRTLMEQGGRLHLVIAINDRIADGTDVSWLWDADFEQLATIKDSLSTIITSGLRAWDMAVRLKYAGLDPARIVVEEDMRQAIARGLRETSAGETLYVLPTYTAMLEMRRIINRMGVGKPYWEA